MKKILIFLIFTLIGGYLFAQTPLYLRNKTVTQVWGLDTNTVILYGDSTWYYSNEPLYLDYPAYYLDDFAVGGNDSLVLFVNGTSGKIDTLPYSSISGGMGLDSAAIAGICWQLLQIDSITGCSPVTIYDGRTYTTFSDSAIVTSTSSEDSILFVGGPNKVMSFGKENQVKGQYSFAHGGTNTVTGGSSFSSGGTNTVSGDNAGAFGENNTVSADISFATGNQNQIDSTMSFAAGYKNTITEKYATALGYENDAIGLKSFAICDSSIAVGYGSFAGSRAKANGFRSFAWGDSTRVEGDHDIGLGYNNKLLGAQRNVGIGYNNTLNDSIQVLIGSENTGTSIRCFGIGDNNTLTGGVASSFAAGVSNTVTITATAYAAIGIGYLNTATASVVIGHNNTGTAGAGQHVVIGASNSNTGFNPGVVLGNLNTTNANLVNIIGYQNTSNVDASNVIGYQSVNSAAYATTIGAQDTASGYAANAFGMNSSARDTAAVSFGRFNKSQGKYSLTGGYSNAASGDFSIAWGYNNTINSNKDYSYVFGSGITAKNTGITSHNLTAQDTVFIGDSSYIIEETDTLRIYSPKVVKLGAGSLIVKRNGDIVIPDGAYFEYEPPHVYSYVTDTGFQTQIATDSVWYALDSTATHLTTSEAHEFSVSGDTIEYTGRESAHILFDVKISMSGGLNDDYQLTLENITDGVKSPALYITTTGTTNYQTLCLSSYDVNADPNDKYVIKIRNLTDTDDATIRTVYVFGRAMHFE